MINLSVNQLNRVPRRVGLLNTMPRHPSLKDAHRSNHQQVPKDNEEVNVHVKCLRAMLDAATVVDLVHNHEDGVWGHELVHWQSPRRYSASGITPLEESGRRRHHPIAIVAF
jgi:hypothetical protein